MKDEIYIMFFDPEKLKSKKLKCLAENILEIVDGIEKYEQNKSAKIEEIQQLVRQINRENMCKKDQKLIKQLKLDLFAWTIKGAK